jgi:hypothetical protein
MSEITRRTDDRDIEHARSFDPERGAFAPPRGDSPEAKA